MKLLVLILFYILFLGNNAYPVNLEKIKCFEADGTPKSIAISPRGDIAVVSNLEGGSVWLIDTVTKKVLKKIKFKKTPGTGFNYQKRIKIPSFQEKPVESAFSNGDRYIWISLHNAGGVVIYDRKEKLEGKSSYKKAWIYDTSNDTTKIMKLPFIKTGVTPKVIAVSPDDNWVYVANWHSNDVSVINARTFEKLKNMNVIRIPRGIIFTPDGEYAFVANMGSNYLSKIDVVTHNVIENKVVGFNPRHLVISDDGKYLYISLNMPGLIKKFDVQRGMLIATTAVGKMPRTIDLSNDGRYLFVANYGDNSITIVNTEAMSVIKTFSDQLRPCGLCFSKDRKELWVTNYYSNTVCIYKFAE